ncbi:hypothetical protein CLF_102298 [Clonorchis sinensis]|uniref:Uncharacterized protein n=1 Tax=Clonorchis sinensis TaxID=79923 RepID=G7YMZ8_CLOSI|nr:hypothetical protein CLF_102298 [Clonorchis sinensis]
MNERVDQSSKSEPVRVESRPELLFRVWRHSFVWLSETDNKNATDIDWKAYLAASTTRCSGEYVNPTLEGQEVNRAPQISTANCGTRVAAILQRRHVSRPELHSGTLNKCPQTELSTNVLKRALTIGETDVTRTRNLLMKAVVRSIRSTGRGVLYSRWPPFFDPSCFRSQAKFSAPYKEVAISSQYEFTSDGGAFGRDSRRRFWDLLLRKRHLTYSAKFVEGDAQLFTHRDEALQWDLQYPPGDFRKMAQAPKMFWRYVDDTFDLLSTIDPRKIWRYLAIRGVPSKSTALVMALYAKSYGRVRVCGELLTYFVTSGGVRQAGDLSKIQLYPSFMVFMLSSKKAKSAVTVFSNLMSIVFRPRHVLRYRIVSYQLNYMAADANRKVSDQILLSSIRGKLITLVYFSSHRINSTAGHRDRKHEFSIMWNTHKCGLIVQSVDFYFSGLVSHSPLEPQAKPKTVIEITFCDDSLTDQNLSKALIYRTIRCTMPAMVLKVTFSDHHCASRMMKFVHNQFHPDFPKLNLHSFHITKTANFNSRSCPVSKVYQCRNVEKDCTACSELSAVRISRDFKVDRTEWRNRIGLSTGAREIVRTSTSILPGREHDTDRGPIQLQMKNGVCVDCDSWWIKKAEEME